MNKRILVAVLVSVLALAVVSCAPQMAEAPAYDGAEGAAERVRATGAVESAVAEDETISGSGGGQYAAIERLIIRNASLDMVVPDTQDALDAITELVGAHEGAYVVEANTHKVQNALRASISFRIPAEALDRALVDIRALATEVRRENVSGSDVTEDYVDQQSRLRSLEATQAKLEEFLDEAEDTEAALDVYERIVQVNAEIEHVKGRIKYLEELAALSFVSVELTPDELAQPIEVGGWRLEGTLHSAVQSLIDALQWLARAAIWIVVTVIPILIAIAIPIVAIVFIIRAIRRRGRARKAEASEAGVAEGGEVVDAVVTEADEAA